MPLDKSQDLNKTPLQNSMPVLRKACVDCPLRCSKLILENQRTQILKYFYNLEDSNLRRLFVKKCVDSTGDQERFYFTINGKKMQVCKNFFLNTLVISHSFMASAMQTQFDDSPIGKEDQDKTLIERAIEHIRAIPRVIKCVKVDADGPEYEEYSVKVEVMYEYYKKFCRNNKFQILPLENYRKIFNDQDVAIKSCRNNLPDLEVGDVTILSLQKKDDGKKVST